MIQCFGQLGWEQAFDIFDINFTVNYGTIDSKMPKISWQPAAERKATPMMSFCYDVIHIHSVHRGSNVLR